jgi:hypothetical protein
MSDIEVTTLSNGVPVVEQANQPVVADDVKSEPAVQAEESSTEAAAETPKQDETHEDQDEDKTPKWAKKRFAELAAQRDSERQRADKALQMLERAMARQQQDDGFTPVPDDDGKPPKPEQYRSHDEYLAALVDYRVQEGMATQRARDAAETRRKTLDEREAKVRAETPDYNEAIAAFMESPVISNPLVAEFLAESDLGPKVAYHLGKHPEVLAEISNLPTARMLARFGSIEASLTAPKEPIKPVVSAAPKPATPIAGGASPGGEWDPSAPQDFEAYKRNRLKQKQSAGQR